jgi:transcriptional regulator with XRE-family HTH domain
MSGNRKTTAKPIDPAASARSLYGSELRFHREKRGLSQAGLAALLHVTASFVANLERVHPALAQALDHVLETDGFFQRNVTAGRMQHPEPVRHQTLSDIETHATSIREWSPLLIPAPLRTTAYAHALAQAYGPLTTVPNSAPDPEPHPVSTRPYWAVLDQAALQRPVGTRAVMADQLRHLAQQARQHHAFIQILPFDEGAHAGMDSALKLLTTDDGALLAYKGGPDYGVLIEDPPTTHHHSLVLHQIQTQALPPRASLDLIEATAEEYERGLRARAHSPRAVQPVP